MKVAETWSAEALNLFEKLVSTASNVFFKKSDDIRDKEITFGEIIVEKDDKEFNVGVELVRLKLACTVPATKFLRAFNGTVSSVIERWNDNSRLGGVLNTPDFIEVGQIASKGFQDHPFLFKYLEKRAEQSLLSAEIEIANTFSVSKVSQWLDKNSNVEQKDPETNAIDIDKLMLNEARPLSLVSPTNRSQSSTHSQKPSQSISDGQKSSSQSEVPSATENATGNHTFLPVKPTLPYKLKLRDVKMTSSDEDFGSTSFMEKTRFRKSDGVGVQEGGLLDFMKRK